MIDSHCHLTDPRLQQQLPAVLSRAHAAGLTGLTTIGTSVPDSLAAVQLAESLMDLKPSPLEGEGRVRGNAIAPSRPQIRASVGIHPNHSHEHTPADADQIAEIATQHQSVVAALGEMGLDYFHQFADRAHQRAVFIAQLNVAAAGINGKPWPVIIHSRLAIADTLAVLKDFPTVPCVFHCFTGSPHEADHILTAGYYLGFTGPVTYKKNDELRTIARLCPLDKLLIETDAPYLSPEPHRSQKINEPALVTHVCQTIAQTKNISPNELSHATTENTHRLYRWHTPLTA